MPLPDDSLSTLRVESAETKENNNAAYYVYIYARHYGHDDQSYYGEKQYYYRFDLVKKPEDICLKLVGEAYRKIGIESNVVKIPKATLKSVFKSYEKIEGWRP